MHHVSHFVHGKKIQDNSEHIFWLVLFNDTAAAIPADMTMLAFIETA